MAVTARRFNPYPAYKDSGVEWLGEIPAHWELKRLRSTVTSCQNGVWGDEPDGVHDVVCVRVADFDRVEFRVDIADPTLRSIDQGVVAARGLRPGDLLLEKSGGGENQPVGAVVLYDHTTPAVCSNFVARITIAERHDARFLTYLHAALYALRVNTRHIKQSTGIQNLDSASYLSESTGLPPEPEQRAIAAFLDRETARIDALVAKKERLIALLQEQRTALITRAVTKGLDPTVPMKDSGVEWLGDIPAHWEVKRLRHISPSLGVGVVVNPSIYVADEGLPFLYGSDISEGGIHAAEARRISPQDSRRLPKSELRPGDLVMVRVGAPGVTAVVPPDLDGANCASLLVIRRQAEIASSWLCYALNSRYVRCQVEIVQYGAAQEQFNVGHAVNFVIAVPPPMERFRVAEYLDRETARIDALVAKVRDAIERLKELRTALISAAVTGKIDVRAASAEAAAGQGGAA